MSDPSQSPLKSVRAEIRNAMPMLGIVSFFINILMLTSPIFMMQTFDRVLSSGHLETLVFLTLIAGIAVLVMGLLEMVRGKALARVGRWFEQKLSPDLISTSMRSTLFGVPSSAQPLRDLGTIRTFLSGPGVNALFDAPWVPIFLVVIWLMHPYLGMIGLGAAIILFTLAVLNEYTSRKPLGDASKLSIANMQKADSAIRNADVFHAMGMLPGFLSGWTVQNDNALKLQLKAVDRNATLVGISKFFRLFVQILILAVGAYLVLQGQLTSGGMIAGSILLGRALAPVEQAIGAWKGLVAARDAYGRLERQMEGIPPEPDAMPLPAPTGRLSCEQLVYVPRGREQPVLNGVQFALDPGDALGIIGPSAAGKSTLCRLLVGSWRPTRGRVRLDGADVFAWPSQQLGAYVGYLPQDVELFDGNVRDNIARLSPQPDAEAVVHAARTAGVHEIILRLPNGYETEIGERGMFLSGGQRQRIGLARALYGKPKLIVLDEPNASLDSEGEEALVRAILAAKQWGATVVIVAHQPRILGPVDKLLLLRDGRVELFGPRDEVLQKLRAAHTPPAPAKPRVVASERHGKAQAVAPEAPPAPPAQERSGD